MEQRIYALEQSFPGWKVCSTQGLAEHHGVMAVFAQQSAHAYCVSFLLCGVAQAEIGEMEYVQCS